MLEILAEPLFGLDWAAWLAGYGLPAPGGAVMAYFLVGGPLIGVLAVWLYAAMRPRFGAGPGPAIRAGLVVWALACLFPTAGLAAYGLVAMDAHFWVPALFPVVRSACTRPRHCIGSAVVDFRHQPSYRPPVETR